MIRAMFWCVLFAVVVPFVAPLSVLAQIPTISRIAARAIYLWQQNEAVAEFDLVEAR
jgi:hypothetical protein